MNSGEVFLGTTEIIRPHQLIQVQQSNFHIHENWDPETVSNDIALIELPTDAQLNSID